MSAFDWQTWLALAAVLFAAAFLVRRVYGVVTGDEGSGCGTGGCGSCPSASTASNQNGRELPLVSLELQTGRDD